MSRYFYLLILLLCSTTALHAEMYRWTDENGKVHYTDSIPTQHKHRGHTKLNEQGVIVGSVTADFTPAQKQHRIQQKKLHTLQQQFLQQHRNRDQSLLDQFDSADDLIMTRDGKVAGIERSINVMKNTARKERKMLAKLQQRIDAMQAKGKSVPVDMIQKLLRLRHSVKESDAEIAREEGKKQHLHDQFTQDLQRYRHLKQPDKYPASVSQEGESEPLEGVINCSPGTNCKPLWKRAVAYVKKYSDTAVKYQSEEIIITERATQGKQISLILSLIGEADGERFSIYLDVQCRASARGALCDSEQAKSVLQGFRPTVLNETAPAPESSSNPPTHAVATP